ncbi:DNA-binding response OmpR family regulator [Granulicella aggregans]|uniref:DNA-binding response OmpR family regulator n=1 Tax=Granulicella aggregans TaxID=474949 RepID=A0A7W8E3G6_9BACT|nr:response regulator [Granulicella aggregans]MBB5057451.1 DNA-binding response OmpR family regulator [Granulicella aggregans]
MVETAAPRVLVVDDDDNLREVMTLILEQGGFQVKSAWDVNSALGLIGCQTFDVLISDLHMPSAGDGLTVVGAMRHSNPKAVTIIFSAYPEMKEAAAAILAQTDDIIVKPEAIGDLVRLIREKLEKGKTAPRVLASVATILEESSQTTIENWLSRVLRDDLVITVRLEDSLRTAHLPQLIRDLVFRLRNPQPLGSRALISSAAAEHGVARRVQGYTAAMMVEESRMLQVSIFQTLQNNLNRVNFSLVLVGVMEIADEVDSQLAQAMTSYVAQSKVDALPITA